MLKYQADFEMDEVFHGLKCSFCELKCGYMSILKHGPYIFKVLSSIQSTTLEGQINEHYHQQFKSNTHKDTK
jgi:hypothetical protein